MKTRKRQSREDWHPEDIKAKVRKSGTTLTALAIQAGLSNSACRKSLTVASPASDKVISEKLNIPLHELWPSRYDATGKRIKNFHKRENSSPKEPVSQRLSEGVA